MHHWNETKQNVDSVQHDYVLKSKKSALPHSKLLLKSSKASFSRVFSQSVISDSHSCVGSPCPAPGLQLAMDDSHGCVGRVGPPCPAPGPQLAMDDSHGRVSSPCVLPDSHGRVGSPCPAPGPQLAMDDCVDVHRFWSLGQTGLQRSTVDYSTMKGFALTVIWLICDSLHLV